MVATWFTFIAFLVLATASMYLAIEALRRRLIFCARPFIAICSCLAVYLIGGAFEIIYHDLSWMQAWNNVIYLGLVWLGPLWLFIALSYARGGTSSPIWASVLLFSIPFATLAIKYTDSLHGLCYSSIGINQNEFIWTISFIKGPWYWVHITYSAITLFTGTMVFLAVFFQTTGRFRKQALLLVITGALPLTSLVIYQSGYFLWGLDIIPYSFSLAILLLAIGLLRQNLFYEIPLSWRSILETVTAGIIVLDRSGNVLEINDTARAAFGISRAQPITASWTELVAQNPEFANVDISSESSRSTFSRAGPSGQILIRAHTTPIRTAAGEHIGRTVFLTLETEKPVPAHDQTIERDAARLVEGMEKDQWYLDPELGLEALARRVKLPRNRVSFLLNRRFKSSAKDFINGYRVREAMKRLTARPENILDVCFDVGFNAKATFYAAFKKHTGKTPSDFLGKK